MFTTRSLCYWRQLLPAIRSCSGNGSGGSHDDDSEGDERNRIALLTTSVTVIMNNIRCFAQFCHISFLLLCITSNACDIKFLDTGNILNSKILCAVAARVISLNASSKTKQLLQRFYEVKADVASSSQKDLFTVERVVVGYAAWPGVACAT